MQELHEGESCDSLGLRHLTLLFLFVSPILARWWKSSGLGRRSRRKVSPGLGREGATEATGIPSVSERPFPFW